MSKRRRDSLLKEAFDYILEISSGSVTSQFFSWLLEKYVFYHSQLLQIFFDFEEIFKN